MDLYDIGFSIIRLSTNKNSYTYEYAPGINTFPEETFLHEFLHTLERICKEYGYDIPELHSHDKYNYKEEGSIGIKQWYQDYMNCKILDKNTNQYVGLNPAVYKLKPAHKSDFEYPIEIDFAKEPENIIEEVKEIFKKLKKVFKTIE